MTATSITGIGLGSVPNFTTQGLAKSLELSRDSYAFYADLTVTGTSESMAPEITTPVLQAKIGDISITNISRVEWSEMTIIIFELSLGDPVDFNQRCEIYSHYLLDFGINVFSPNLILFDNGADSLKIGLQLIGGPNEDESVVIRLSYRMLKI